MGEVPATIAGAGLLTLALHRKDPVFEEDVHILAIHARKRHLNMEPVFILIRIAGRRPAGSVHAAKRVLEQSIHINRRKCHGVLLSMMALMSPVPAPTDNPHFPSVKSLLPG